MSDTYEIKLKVELDDKKVPTALSWEASAQTEGAQYIKAFMLALFDTNSRDTLKIDLWTQDMQIMEMDRFFYQTLRSMCDTYRTATKNEALAGDMDQFIQHFGAQTGIIPGEV